MKQKKVVAPELIKVSVLMVAITEGQNGGKIVKAGEKFLFNGNLTRSRELPSWAAIAEGEKFNLEKFLADYDKKKAAAAKKDAAPAKKDGEAPAAPQGAAPAAPALPSL